MFNKIDNLVGTLALTEGISFLSGMFGFYSDTFDILIGLILIVCTIWLFVIVRSTEFRDYLKTPKE